MSSTRDRILDALETVLVEAGPAGATLEAVAAKAGVSKGGLLYHFGTKEALFTGLCDRLRALGEADASHVHGDVIASYLATSATAQDAYTRTLVAALRLVGTSGVEVEQAIVDSLDHWRAVLGEEISDPALLRLVMLVGDGLYLRALIGAPADPVDADLPDLIGRVIQGE
ncbi:MAG: TetR/AcrR family transcriptional regulator [Mobilicoccus sp.]|nr:TetR/AcrR family transcriptional regulator [Mobilicoccus sp.]